MLSTSTNFFNTMNSSQYHQKSKQHQHAKQHSKSNYAQKQRYQAPVEMNMNNSGGYWSYGAPAAPINFNNNPNLNFNFNSNQQHQQLQTDLTINLTKNQPRLVVFNSNQFNPIAPLMPTGVQTRQQATNTRKNPFNGNNNFSNQFNQPQQQANVVAVSTGTHKYNTRATSASIPNGVNRFKFFKPSKPQGATNSPGNGKKKNTAPYNTTQYIMYDYNKRVSPVTATEPSLAEQQFTDDWNMMSSDVDALLDTNSLPSFTSPEPIRKHINTSVNASTQPDYLMSSSL